MTSPEAPSAAATAGRSLLYAAFAAATAGTPVQGFCAHAATSPEWAGALDPEASPKEEEDGQEGCRPAPATSMRALLKTALGLQQSLRHSPGTENKAQALADDDPERWDRERAFEIADSLEGGMARETATDFTTPLRRSSRLWRFRVVRSEDKLSARLLTDSGDFLMFASVALEARSIDLFLYDPGGDDAGLYDPAAPTFSMGFNEARTEWRLVQERCENCRFAPPHLSCSRLGKQQLALIRHSRHMVGDGISNCMEVTIPGLYSDHSAVVWCPMLGRKDLGAACSGCGGDRQRLITKKPVWNDEVESLVLDFKGRDVLASAKNFQLALEQKPQHVICQYGKLSATNFGLDFRYPLSAVQAFGMAMSTLFWA